jgi:hypothetical protein
MLRLRPGLERGNEEISGDVKKCFERSELAMIVGTILKNVRSSCSVHESE